MILIDYKDRRPIYEQIIETFQQMILCGALEANQPMPSVRSLAMELSLNPNTIQRAYQELERSGYIYTVKGKGSFVSEITMAAKNKRVEIANSMKELVKQANSLGITHTELHQMWQEALDNIESEG